MRNQNKSNLLPIIIIGVLFFIFGFVTWLNSTLIPYLQLACELSNFEAMLVAFAFYISYFVLAIPSSWILEKTGFKNGMSLGLSVMAIGSLVFIPAAISRTYSLFLTGLFIQGAGLSLLQTASNPYVTILGPIESAAKRMSIMGLANKIAGILSPLILGAIILKNTDAIESSIITMSIAEKNSILDALAHRVIEPYVIMAVVLFVLAVAIRFSALPKICNHQSDEQSVNNKQKGIFSYTYLWLGVMALFFYVGVEVIAVDTIITYGKSIGFEISKARFFASFTLFGMIAGYLLGIITIPKIISQSKALAIMAVLGVVFTLLGVVTEGMMSVISIALLGFANAIMWPAIWPLSIDGLGKHTKLGSALLIMAIAGGAILPLVYGALSDLPHIGTQTAYLIMVPCYLFIMFFAIKGYKIGRRLS